MPYFYYWEPQSQRWLPKKELVALLNQFYKPPKQHGKKNLEKWQKQKVYR